MKRIEPFIPLLISILFCIGIWTVGCIALKPAVDPLPQMPAAEVQAMLKQREAKRLPADDSWNQILSRPTPPVPGAEVPKSKAAFIAQTTISAPAAVVLPKTHTGIVYITNHPQRFGTSTANVYPGFWLKSSSDLQRLKGSNLAWFPQGTITTNVSYSSQTEQRFFWTTDQP